MSQLALVPPQLDAQERNPTFDDGQPLRLSELTARADLLMPLSEPARRALTLLDRDDVSIRAIGSLIEGDTSVSIGLVRLANASFYRGVRDVLDVTSAMTRLGRRNSRELIFALSILRPIQLSSTVARLVRRSALCSAATARILGEHLHIQDADALFFKTLVQDIGQLLLAMATPVNYAKAIQDDPACGALLERERSWAGFTHADVGAALMERWGMPPVVVAHVKTHHEPRDTKDISAISVTRAAGLLGNQLARASLGLPRVPCCWREDPLCVAIEGGSDAVDALEEACEEAAGELLDRFQA